MSITSRWHKELDHLEALLTQFAGQLGQIPDPSASSKTLDRRNQIDSALAQIAIDTDKILRYAKKSEPQNKHNKAIAWWSKQLVIKVKALSSEYVMLQNRKMWLRLMQARFAGDSSKDRSGLEAKHLVDLVVRKKSLDELEQALRKDMAIVVVERDRLRGEYESLTTADQNWLAGGSFQGRLGVDVHHARKNPSAKALAECLNIIALPCTHPREDRLLKNVNKDLSIQSNKLAEQCSDLATSWSRAPDLVDKLSITRFHAMIDTVSQLNEQARRQFAKALSLTIKPSRPKLVQKSQKTDKTVPHP